LKDLVSLLPLIAIAVVFWLFIIRPASRKNKEMARLQAGVSVGDTVMTTSGIFGTVSRLTDDRVFIEIAPGVEIQAVRGAIGQVVPGGADAPADVFDDAAENAPDDNADDAAISLDKDGASDTPRDKDA
jgi:preprotein translocase subunit YajC